MINVVIGEEAINVVSERTFFKVYPNPTRGTFTLELTGLDESEKSLVEIYDMKGDKLSAIELNGERKHQFTLSGKAEGIYLLKIIKGKKCETARIIKQD